MAYYSSPGPWIPEARPETAYSFLSALLGFNRDLVPTMYIGAVPNDPPFNDLVRQDQQCLRFQLQDLLQLGERLIRDSEKRSNEAGGFLGRRQ
jgi:hypothetical protein